MSKIHKPLRTAICGCALLLFSVAPLSLSAVAQDPSNSAQAPDNSGRNKAHAKTADQQKDNTSDREITRKIRASVVADKSLSTYAHNVKIIAQNGAVTLKGPVHSDEEKQAVASKAAEVVGQDKVTDQLTVKK